MISDFAWVYKSSHDWVSSSSSEYDIQFTTKRWCAYVTFSCLTDACRISRKLQLSELIVDFCTSRPLVMFSSPEGLHNATTWHGCRNSGRTAATRHDFENCHYFNLIDPEVMVVLWWNPHFMSNLGLDERDLANYYFYDVLLIRMLKLFYN